MKAGVVWHNDELRRSVETGVSAQDLRRLLEQHDCLTFPQLPSGLFPAINTDLHQDTGGYANAWLRDSSWVAYGLWRGGQTESARKAARGLTQCLRKDQRYFEAVIKLGHAPHNAGKRPPVRFVGPDAKPLAEWANAQDDALGVALWLIGRMVRAGDLVPGRAELEVVEMVVTYLATIRYWRDRDSGQWEELPRLNATSGGTVVAGLTAVRELLPDRALCDELIAKGRDELDALLPRESATPGREREYDAGLLMLIEPLGVVTGTMAEKIVNNTREHLLGEIGVRRYPGDSYWGPDYRNHFSAQIRAGDFSKPADMAKRNAFLQSGDEAKWTLFDPLLAAYHAKKHQQNDAEVDKKLAIHHLMRSLAQIVEVGGSWRIPEAFFLEKSQWAPNDNLGLLWSQANLLSALRVFDDVLGAEPLSNR